MSLTDILLESELERARIEATAEAVLKRLEPLLRPKAPEVDPFVSYALDDAAARMNISRYTLDSLRGKGLLRSRKVGGAVRVLERDIQAFYAAQEALDEQL